MKTTKAFKRQCLPECEFDRLYPEAPTHYPPQVGRHTGRAVMKTKAQLPCVACRTLTTWTFYSWRGLGAGPMVCSPECLPTVAEREPSQAKDVK